MIRIARENEKFDIDHYMADYMDDEMIQEILKYQCTWNDLTHENPNPKSSDSKADSKITLNLNVEGKSIFSDEEKEILRNLPNKEFLMSKEENRISMLNLLDILLSFTYDLKTTFGQHTVESGWTVTRLSSVLSSCDVSFIVQNRIIVCLFLCIYFRILNH